MFRDLVLVLLCGLACIPLTAVSTLGQVPSTVSFQGHLADSSGVPINGVYDLGLSLHTELTGGNQVWFESHSNVQIVDGLLNINLGSSTPLDVNDFDTPLYLEIAVDQEPLPGRTKLTTVPYAFRAALADTALVARSVSNLCYPGDFLYCYTGPDGTLDVGECRPGTRACDPSRSTFGACSGDVVPIAESCDGLDNDCDGVPDNPPPCCEDDSEPNDTFGTAEALGSLTDCTESTDPGHLADDSDIDWFSYSATDTFGCDVDPRATVSESNLDVCLYADCLVGTTNVSCILGTSSSAGGYDGCCTEGLGQVVLSLDCVGASGDHANLFAKVYYVGAALSCKAYSLTVGY